MVRRKEGSRTAIAKLWEDALVQGTSDEFAGPVQLHDYSADEDPGNPSTL
jgi:hypothetical protein